jgi:Tfp pilus assembly protein PilX
MRNNERGIALVLALFLMTALSILGASLMFLSQTETYASMNYRMMSQSRYAAEAGIHSVANYLLDQTKYNLPNTALNPSDPINGIYNLTTSPVTLVANNRPVVLSWDTTKSNYPLGSVVTAFAAAAQGTLTAGNQGLSYKTTATLLTMQEFDSFDGTPSTIQTWSLVADGGLANSTKVTVEVSALFETPKLPAYSMAAFATDNQCGALNLQGNVSTDSYNSVSLTGTTTPPQEKFDGDLGTNGNLDASGNSATIYGNLYTPRTGVGACSTGNVSALTETGTVLKNPDGSSKDPQQPVQLPKAVKFPTPATGTFSPLPAYSLNNAGDVAAACVGLGYSVGDVNCVPTGTTLTLLAPPCCNAGGTAKSMPSLNLASGTQLVLKGVGPPAQRFDFNSLTEAGHGAVGAQVATPAQGVIVNIVGKDNTGADIATPLDLQGGSGLLPTAGCATCSTFDASIMQFVYAGTGLIKITGSSSAGASFYAPNAAGDLGGSADLYGAIVTKTLVEHGNMGLHYDRRLQQDFWISGMPMTGTFSWKRF